MTRLVALLAGLVVAVSAGAARAFPAMWTVRDADSEFVLFGSIHLLPPDLTWRPPALEAALGHAEDFWL